MLQSENAVFVVIKLVRMTGGDDPILYVAQLMLTIPQAGGADANE
jgi:hypothetical protein